MKKRFIGPANPGPDGQDEGHEVVLSGRSLGIVRSGEVIEVPDDVEAAWSAELWEDVKASASKKGDA